MATITISIMIPGTRLVGGSVIGATSTGMINAFCTTSHRYVLSVPTNLAPQNTISRTIGRYSPKAVRVLERKHQDLRRGRKYFAFQACVVALFGSIFSPAAEEAWAQGRSVQGRRPR
eukprot:3062712-Rhodomonas_salina.1